MAGVSFSGREFSDGQQGIYRCDQATNRWIRSRCACQAGGKGWAVNGRDFSPPHIARQFRGLAGRERECLALRGWRAGIEILDHGAPKTGFLQDGDRVRMEARTPDGSTPFGALSQRVRIARPLLDEIAGNR